MALLDHLDRSEGLRAVFGDTEVTLRGVRLHEVVLHRDGPTVTLRLDLKEFPKNPPPKWVKAAHNVAQVRLALDMVGDLEIAEWSTNSLGDIEIIPLPDAGYRVRFVGTGCKLSAGCDRLHLDSISGYHDTDRK